MLASRSVVSRCTSWDAGVDVLIEVEQHLSSVEAVVLSPALSSSRVSGKRLFLTNFTIGQLDRCVCDLLSAASDEDLLISAEALTGLKVAQSDCFLVREDLYREQDEIVTRTYGGRFGTEGAAGHAELLRAHTSDEDEENKKADRGRHFDCCVALSVA